MEWTKENRERIKANLKRLMYNVEWLIKDIDDQPDTECIENDIDRIKCLAEKID